MPFKRRSRQDTAMSSCPKNAQVHRKTLALVPHKFPATQRDLTVQKKTIDVADSLLGWPVCPKNSDGVQKKAVLKLPRSSPSEVGSHLLLIAGELTSVLAVTTSASTLSF
jgi:hypothetical protein